MNSVEDLLDRAKAGPISSAEMDELAALAKATGVARRVVDALVLARPHGPSNLVRGRALMLAHAEERIDHPTRRRATGNPIPAAQRYHQLAADMVVTYHAVDQYVKRHGGDRTNDVVLAELASEAAMASPIKERSVNGDEQRRSPNGVVFVVRRDHEQRCAVCVTVLPSDSGPDAAQRPSRWARKRD